MKKILFVFVLLLGGCSLLWADDVSFVAEAPQSVVAGQQFRLVYKVNKDAKDLRAPEMPDFEVLMGPSTSSQSSIQIINGEVTRTHTVSYTYILMANTPGSYTIAPASIVVKGQKYTSQSLTIKVLPPDQNTGSQASANNSQIQGRNTSSQSSLSANQIFVKQSFSKTKAYEQEAILVTYKLYARVDVVQIGHVKFPEFKDFYTQEIDLDPNRPWQIEHYDGLNYNTIILKQYLVFPQRSGSISLDAGEVEAVIRVANQTRSNSFFDDFFNTYQDVRKQLTIPAAKLTVKPLPKGAPAGFNGAVGQFQLQSDLSSNSVQVNEAITLKVKVSGKGNLKLVKVPAVTFPADFDAYDPKNDNKIKANMAGVSGSKTVEYVAIPRFGGTFDIPAVRLVYFDPEAEQYKTLQTQPYTVEVSGVAAADAAAPTVVLPGAHKEQIKNLGTDIRFIHSGADKDLKPMRQAFFGSPAYYLAYALPLAVFIMLLIVLQKQAKENANLVRVKNKRANKLARKRLKNAALCMKAGDKARFYEAAVQALWGYIADKLNMAAVQLTKDNVQEKLIEHGASAELINDFLQTLSDCEFARYSPIVDDSLSMENCYNRAADLIGKLEDTLK